MRLFIAIPVPDEVQRVLNKFSLALRDIKGARGSFPKSTDMHITLQFLGDIAEDKIDLLKLNLHNTLNGFNEIPPIQIEQVGAFPNLKNPRTIWVGGVCSEELQNLVNSIYSVSKKIGVNEEHKSFIPHITVMRVKLIEDSKYWVNGLIKLRWIPQTIPVTEVTLFHSKLTERGPIYTALQTYRSAK